MFPSVVRLLPIKDLKDLRVLFCRRCYRHVGPKGPEERREMFFHRIAGAYPPRFLGYRSAGACPPRALKITVVRGPVPRVCAPVPPGL